MPEFNFTENIQYALGMIIKDLEIYNPQSYQFRTNLKIHLEQLVKEIQQTVEHEYTNQAIDRANKHSNTIIEAMLSGILIGRENN